MRHNATGYAPDLLRFICDLENLNDDRRCNVDENLPKLIGVIIEYIHGKLAESMPKHSISTVRASTYSTLVWRASSAVSSSCT